MFWNKKPSTDTDEGKIEEALSRSVDSIYPEKESLKKMLLSGKRMRIYFGIDPTSTYVHIGHSTNYLLLKRLHKLGHEIIVLIGDFTAKIGDPSDKTSDRKRLTKEEVEENLKSFKEQIGKILDFKDKKNPIRFEFNSEWLSNLMFEDVVDLASNFTVQQMIQRDAFERRLKEERPLYVHEFFYPLMQGYDSVALDVDVEVGGTEQTFNMLAGRTLLKKMKNKEKFVVATTLLENPKTGEKLMSKSLGTGIGLNEEPNSMYGKTMALADEGVKQCFIDCTEIPLDEIENIMKGHPKEAKMRLARELVTMYHNKESAETAEASFVETFSEGGAPEDIQELHQTKNIRDIIIEAKIVASNSEWKRLIDAGAVKNIETGEVIHDAMHVSGVPETLKIGKKKFVKIIP